MATRGEYIALNGRAEPSATCILNLKKNLNYTKIFTTWSVNCCLRLCTYALFLLTVPNIVMPCYIALNYIQYVQLYKVHTVHSYELSVKINIMIIYLFIMIKWFKWMFLVGRIVVGGREG